MFLADLYILTVDYSYHPSVCPYVHPYVCVSPFCLSASFISSLFKFCFSFTFNWCSGWNNTPRYLHYFHYLDSIDTMGASDNDGEVDDAW